MANTIILPRNGNNNFYVMNLHKTKKTQKLANPNTTNDKTLVIPVKVEPSLPNNCCQIHQFDEDLYRQTVCYPQMLIKAGGPKFGNTDCALEDGK